MNTNNLTLKFILPCMVVLAAAMSQALAAETTASTVTGEITPKLYYFNYFDGPGADLTQFMERYSSQEAWSGDRDSGFYADLDLNLTVSDQSRDILTLERQGFGLNNHRGKARVNLDNLGFTGYYSHYRSASGGIDYLYNPSRVPGGTDPSYFFPAGTNTNSGYVAQFNDDSRGQTEYKIDRTTYGVGMKFKPGMLGEGTWLSVNYDGYKRDGNRFSTYVAGGSDVAGTAARVLQRWRGFDQDIEEKMNKLSVNLTASPGGLFQLSYDGSYETFDNQARDNLMGDFAANFGGFFAPASANKDLHFVPDSTLMTHAIRLSRTFGETAVAAGYGMSRLEQDSFTITQSLAGYNTGKISTDNAFLNINHRITPAMGLEGYIKYANRDNDSTFPAAGLISATTNQTLGVRIDSVESWSYGLAATLRALPLKSSLTGGWKREDIDRDLTWTDVSATAGIAPQRSLYREQTVSDEVYLKWIARPMQGVTLRVTPSYLWADKTGLVTEPEKSLNLKAAVSYAAADGMQVNGYYNYKHKQNGNNTFTNALARDGLGTSQTQDVDNTFHSAGASLNLTPAEQVSASVSLDWTQNDFESYYFSTNRRRFEAGLTTVNTLNFLIRDTSAYKVDTWSLSLNGDWQASDRLKLNAGYTLSVSKGDVASGLIATELAGTIDGRIDNTLHSFILGANYGLKKNMTLRAGYIYDNYDDAVYDALSGGVHTLMAGVSFAL